VLEAIARGALGDPCSAEDALERALDLAEPDGALLLFLVHPVPGLLERHARQRTAHPALIADILSLLAGRKLVPPPAGPPPPLEPLSASICASTPYSAARSGSGPVSTVSPPLARACRAGNAERIVLPRRPRTRMRYRYAGRSAWAPVTLSPRTRRTGLLAVPRSQGPARVPPSWLSGSSPRAAAPAGERPARGAQPRMLSTDCWSCPGVRRAGLASSRAGICAPATSGPTTTGCGRGCSSWPGIPIHGSAAT
jgi:hypothetical protein